MMSSLSLSLCQFTNSHLSSTKSQTIISTTWKQSEPVYKSKSGQSLLLSPISPQHRPGEWSQILSFNTLKSVRSHTDYFPPQHSVNHSPTIIKDTWYVWFHIEPSKMGVPQRPVRKIRVKSVFTQSLQCVDCPCFQAFVFISPQKSCFITQVSGSSCNSGVITSSVKPPQVCGLKHLLNRWRLNDHLASVRGNAGLKLWGGYALRWERRWTRTWRAWRRTIWRDVKAETLRQNKSKGTARAIIK